METSPQTESLELRYIRLAIEDALPGEHPVDDAAARLIAGQMHGGQTSAMYSLASCGAINTEGLDRELAREARDPQLQEEAREWLGAIQKYRFHHGDRGPVDRWHELTSDEALERSLAAREAGSLVVAAEVEEPAEEEPKVKLEIWVGDLQAYNQGYLQGSWLDATRESEEIQEDIDHILSLSTIPNSEEFFIGDYNGFYGLDLGEYEPLETITRIAKGIEQHGEAFARWVAYHGTSLVDEAERTFEDAFEGHYADERALAEQVAENMGVYTILEEAQAKLPESARYPLTFDIESFDNELTDYYIAPAEDGGVYAYRLY